MKTAEENLMDGLRGAHAAAGIAQTQRACEAVRIEEEAAACLLTRMLPIAQRFLRLGQRDVGAGR